MLSVVEPSGSGSVVEPFPNNPNAQGLSLASSAPLASREKKLQKSCVDLYLGGCHNIRHKDTEHNDTEHKCLFYDSINDTGYKWHSALQECAKCHYVECHYA